MSIFRILEILIESDRLVTDKIIRTVCALHNWLMKTSNTYILKKNVDTGEIIPGSLRQEKIILFQSINGIGGNQLSRH